MARKQRDFNNPIKVTLVYKADKKALSFEVAQYQVTNSHLIMTRYEDSRITKYVDLDELASFAFDEPVRQQPSVQSTPWAFTNGTYTTSINSPATFTNTAAVMSAPEPVAEGPKMQYRGHIVDLGTQKAIAKNPPRPQQVVIKKGTKVPTEDEVIKENAHGAASATFV